MIANLKNLKNIVGTLGSKFTADDFMFNIKTMEKLGNGTLVIDILTQTSTFNGSEIPLSRFANWVIEWCDKQIEISRVAKEDILAVLFTCAIEQYVIDAKNRIVSNVQFFTPDRTEIVTGDFLRFNLACRTDIVTTLKHGEYAFTRHHKTVNEYLKLLVKSGLPLIGFN